MGLALGLAEREKVPPPEGARGPPGSPTSFPSVPLSSLKGLVLGSPVPLVRTPTHHALSPPGPPVVSPWSVRAEALGEEPEPQEPLGPVQTWRKLSSEPGTPPVRCTEGPQRTQTQPRPQSPQVHRALMLGFGPRYHRGGCDFWKAGRGSRCGQDFCSPDLLRLVPGLGPRAFCQTPKGSAFGN